MIEGELGESSPSMLRKLFRLISLPPATRDPKMLTPLPNDSGEHLKTCGLNGVVGDPNEWRGWDIVPRPEAGTGVAAAIGSEIFLEGVSGMLTLLYNAADGRSILRLRFEIKPVDMKAAGSGRAILYASGVSKESEEEGWLSCVRVSNLGRRAPIGRDLEKLGGGREGAACTRGGGCGAASASGRLDAEDEGLRAFDSG